MLNTLFSTLVFIEEHLLKLLVTLWTEKLEKAEHGSKYKLVQCGVYAKSGQANPSKGHTWAI